MHFHRSAYSQSVKRRAQLLSTVYTGGVMREPKWWYLCEMVWKNQHACFWFCFKRTSCQCTQWCNPFKKLKTGAQSVYQRLTNGWLLLYSDLPVPQQGIRCYNVLSLIWKSQAKTLRRTFISFLLFSVSYYLRKGLY